MKNLNELNKSKDVQNDVQKPEGAQQKAPSRLGNFITIAFIAIVLICFILAVVFIIWDSNYTKKQIKASYEKALNSPEMQEYRAREAQRQRELAQQRRLRQLGIDGISKPEQKDDLINAQRRQLEEAALREQQIAERQKTQAFDYSAELAAYNAKLREVEAEEARLKAEAAAQAKAEQERLALEQEEAARQEALKKAQEEERKAAEIKAAQAKAAQEKAARAKEKLKTLKTEKKTLQTTQSNFGSGSSFKPK